MIAIHRLAAMSAALSVAIAPGVSAQVRTPASNPVAAGSNAFAVDFYKALRSRPGNLFFSPINIATAFSMAYSGARGQTAVEMRKVLHIIGTAAENDAATGELQRQMTSETEGAKLTFANAVWLGKRLTLKPDYQRSLERNYDSELPRLDFLRDPQGSQATINRWVSDKTAGKIPDLLRAPPDGPMVITSAVYMKADWLEPFNSSQTRSEDFHLTPTKTVRAPLMHMTKHLGYLDGGVFEAVALPYQGGLSMVLLVPKQTDGLMALEGGLSATALEGWLHRLDAERAIDVTLTLPKFRLDDRIALKPLLKGMGMERAFTDGKADFSGIASDPLFVAAATHQSFISVDEEGTEAAAATAMEIELTAARIPAPKRVTVRADHPFLLLIRDTRGGAIIFMGRLASPAP
jgi:serpin B